MEERLGAACVKIIFRTRPRHRRDWLISTRCAREAEASAARVPLARRREPEVAELDVGAVEQHLCGNQIFYGAFVLNRRVVLHAIDAMPARWRGDADSLPLDRARTAASSPRNDLVKNCRG